MVLPASWAGTDLTSVEISVGYDGSFPVGDVALSALQVTDGSSVSAAPEPSSIAFLAVGLLVIGRLAKWQRREA